MTAYVYLLTNKTHSTLYVGVTSNLEQRLAQHQEHTFPGFTAKYNVEKLVYFDVYDDIYTAISAEKRIKNRDRAWKNNLVNQRNPDWRDLSAQWRDSASQPAAAGIAQNDDVGSSIR